MLKMFQPAALARSRIASCSRHALHSRPSRQKHTVDKPCQRSLNSFASRFVMLAAVQFQPFAALVSRDGSA